MSSLPAPADCASCLCLASRRAARGITRIFDRHLRPHGLRATQFSVIATLALRGRSPMAELAEALGVERTTLTRSVALLEAQGWVRVSPSADARERPLEITAAGRRRFDAALPSWAAAQEEARTLLGPAAAGLKRIAEKWDRPGT